MLKSRHVSVGLTFTWFIWDRNIALHITLYSVNSVLNDILPEMCKAAGLKRKTSHCLRVTCASSLFNAGVEEKLIRERTGHRSDSLFKYEKPSKEKITEVSSVLGPSTSATEVKISEKKDLSCLTSSDAQDVVSAGPLNSCSFANCSVKIKVQYLQ